MTYKEAQSYLNRIREFAIGASVRGRIIEHLSIGSTDWEEMTGFMNLRIRKERRLPYWNMTVWVRAFLYMEYQSKIVVELHIGR